MRDILSRITKWWEAGESFGLATVTRTYRSAPRDPGAALAVSATGHHEVVGSVSGGCVEGAVYELSLDVCQTGTPVFETYGVSDDDAFAVGLTCGGIIDIFVERVDKESFLELGEIAAAVERGEPVAVATVISGPGQVGARRVVWGGDTVSAGDDERHSGRAQALRQGSERLPIGAPGRLGQRHGSSHRTVVRGLDRAGRGSGQRVLGSLVAAGRRTGGRCRRPSLRGAQPRDPMPLRSVAEQTLLRRRACVNQVQGRPLRGAHRAQP